jgi:hypothetical protein
MIWSATSVTALDKVGLLSKRLAKQRRKGRANHKKPSKSMIYL